MVWLWADRGKAVEFRVDAAVDRAGQKIVLNRYRILPVCTRFSALAGGMGVPGIAESSRGRAGGAVDDGGASEGAARARKQPRWGYRKIPLRQAQNRHAQEIAR